MRMVIVTASSLGRTTASNVATPGTAPRPGIRTAAMSRAATRLLLGGTHIGTVPMAGASMPGAIGRRRAIAAATAPTDAIMAVHTIMSLFAIIMTTTILATVLMPHAR